MEKIVRKVPKEGQIDDFYVVLTEWHEENLSLTVIDNEEAWEGQMDSTEMDKMCDIMRKRKEEYIVELKCALSAEKDFTFFIENETFLVKKIDQKSDIKVKFCVIHLHKIPLIPTYFSLLSDVLDQEKKNRSKMLNLSKEVHYLKLEREDLKRQSLQFANEKASLETIFYSKFCEILNAKKEKIALLESQKGANGDALPAQYSVNSLHNINTNEQDVQRNTAAVDHALQNYPATKHKCTITKSSEAPSKENAQGTSITSEVHPNLNHYDSETDIDTDDDSACNNIPIKPCNVNKRKPSCSSLDTLEQDNKRILPKRACSSSSSNSNSNILPKRVHNSYSVVKSSNTSKEKFYDQSTSSHSDREISDEFNSQSLLDDY